MEQAIATHSRKHSALFNKMADAETGFINKKHKTNKIDEMGNEKSTVQNVVFLLKKTTCLMIRLSVCLTVC